MKRFLKDADRSIASTSETLGDLILGWYLFACLSHAMTIEGPILECGSGLTTLLIGAVAQRRGIELWSLEHTQAWGDRVRRALERYRIDCVHLHTSALRDYGGFTWYDPPPDFLRNEYPLVICVEV